MTPLAVLHPIHARKNPEIMEWAKQTFPHNVPYRMDLLTDAGPVDVWTYLHGSWDPKTGAGRVTYRSTTHDKAIIGRRHRLTAPGDMPPARFWVTADKGTP